MNQDVPIEKVIELRELRIGNILSYKGQYVHITNLSCDIDDEYTDEIGFCLLGKTSNEISDWNRTLCRDLERVKLTKEILAKLTLNWRLDVFEMKGYFSIQANQWIPDEENEIASCEHLHQLQNIYHSLMGEELVYKEKDFTDK